ncbi:hypothetical protein RvY_03437 [Ramazzottius varieornatus]|uniref:Uncharacterized protein n=1 Tax=Ramazzottius varieornatus TaxID=947166 RepID=A0A1D1URF7_RAMVA|nr:hypothetical protein RvY_03437 [Ramazzottius varieornatus]
MLAATSWKARIEDVIGKKSESSRRNLMTFSFAGLKQPEKQKNKKRNLTRAVKDNLLAQELDAEPGNKQPSKKQPQDEAIEKLVEGKINDGDISGALRVLSEDSVAAPTPEVLEIPCEKQPAESADSSFPDPPNQETLPDEPQHLKDMIGGTPNGATVALTEAWAKLTTQMLHGKIPDAARRSLPEEWVARWKEECIQSRLGVVREAELKQQSTQSVVS